MSMLISVPDDVAQALETVPDAEVFVTDLLRVALRVNAVDMKETQSFKALLRSMPDVGEDADFARRQDLGRSEALWDS